MPTWFSYKRKVAANYSINNEEPGLSSRTPVVAAPKKRTLGAGHHDSSNASFM